MHMSCSGQLGQHTALQQMQEIIHTQYKVSILTPTSRDAVNVTAHFGVWKVVTYMCVMATLNLHLVVPSK